ncbi:phage tail protein [Pseudomonas sp. KBW05]|uniref:phage tail protein n=1 Tax=Pseudomonas sp. KBW05 TaxID=2153360 RepID=UPI0015AF272C|nr:phage tail protein [Pseudomonas sp. KBW05]
MTDQDSQYFAILTAIGEAKLANAIALGTTLTFAQMAVGDANETKPIPNRLQTKLINECRRAPLNQVKPDPKNPGVIIAEQVIPESVGGWWVRELALYDAAGDMVAIANCAPTYKPLLSQGSGRTQVIRINLVVSSTANIELKIDPSVVLATREFVIEGFARIDSQVFTGTPKAPTPDQFDSSSRLATTEALWRAAGSYRGQYAVDRSFTLSVLHLGQIGRVTGAGGYSVTLPPMAGIPPGPVIRILNASLAAITIISSGPPISGAALTPEGAVILPRTGSIEFYWNGAALVVWGGTEAMRFAGFAALASPDFTGIPTGPTALAGSNSYQLANAAFVWAAVNAYATTVTAALALKAPLASPAFSGVPTAPTAAAGTNTLQLANTAFVWLAINTYATTVSASLNLKANVDSPGFTGVPTAPTPAAGASTKQIATAEFVQAALAAIDPWAMVPVGSYVPLHDVGSVPAPSRTSPFYKYIRLTASDGYNNPILVSESVSGTAPELIATGVVSLAGSPLNGVRISLINTERRTLKAGLPGVVEQDALQNITGTFGGAEASPSTTGAFSNGGWFGSVAAGGNTRNVLNFDASLVVRTAAETRVKSLGVTYYLRVK